jgi:MoaA/NifB/PqqE/SkfB family radical SAM enzyme
LGFEEKPNTSIGDQMLKTMRSNYYAIKSHLDPQQVSFLIFYVTNRCNFRCNFCFYHEEIAKGKKDDELSVEEIKRIAQKAGPIIQLSLTGGEPFLRTEIKEIASIFITHNHVKYLTIPTNGSLPLRIVEFVEDTVARYEQTNFRIVFSIDGIGEDHDRYRSTPGSYKKIQESYQLVSPLRKKYPNLVLDSNSVFSAGNENRILDIVQTIDKDFDFDNISVTYIRGGAKDPSLKKTSFEKYLKLNEFLEGLHRKKEKRFLYPVWRAVRDISREYLIATEIKDQFVTSCVAGRKLIVIREAGEVQPCEILSKTFGNIRNYDYDLQRMVADTANKEICDWIIRTKCKCTFECALAANVIWSRPNYFKLIAKTIRNIGQPAHA